MAGNDPTSSPGPREGQLGQLMRSFDRALRALNRSPLTRDNYLMGVGQIIDYFTVHATPDDPTKVTRERVEMFLVDFAEGHKPATVLTRFAALRVFWNFPLEEGRGARVSDTHHEAPERS